MKSFSVNSHATVCNCWMVVGFSWLVAVSIYAVIAIPYNGTTSALAWW